MIRPKWCECLALVAGLALCADFSRAWAEGGGAAVKRECLHTFEPVTVDGKADEPVWKKATPLGHLGQAWLGERGNPRESVTCRMVWDAESLFLLAEVVDKELVASPDRERPWLGDAVELYLKPAADKPGYFQWIFTPQGQTYARFFPNSKARLEEKDREKKIGMRGFAARCCAVVQQGSGYTLEAKIPWQDMLRCGGRPNPGEVWQLNIARMDRGSDGKVTASCIANITTKKIEAFLHQTEDYPSIKFVGPDVGRLTGIERKALDTSALVGSPEPPSPYRPKRLYPGYSPPFPIMAKPVPGGPGANAQLLVIHQDAPYGPTVMSVIPDQPDSTAPVEGRKIWETPKGGTAYDLAFHPQFPKRPFVYLGWNGPLEGGKRKGKASRITRHTVARVIPLELEPGPGQVVIEWESDGHNGAALCFAPDGKLLVTTGDGTADSDNDVMGQRTDTVQAKVLRLDVDGAADGKGYSVPPDNPFYADKRFAPETYAYGLRNPWRICSDPSTGQIWVGNNGQDMYEQAYLVKPGANYGWSVKEGSAPFHEKRVAGPTPISPPTVEHHHAQFRSLTGGVVIPAGGATLPELAGAYVYGDYSTGRIWAVRHDGSRVVWNRELVDTPFQITAFGFNSRGDLILCDHNGKGGIHTLEKRPTESPTKPFPLELKDTGLFSSVSGHRVAAGVVPYQVNAPFWSDGLLKERFIALPAGKDGLPSSPATMTGKGGWNFPDGTVILKSCATVPDSGNPERKRWIESRLMVKQQNEWAGYSYRWDDSGETATLVGSDGAEREVIHTGPDGKARLQKWRFPSRAECMVCHTRAANFTLGLCTVQTNLMADYIGGKAGQIQILGALGLVSPEVDYRQTVLAEARAQGVAQGLKDQILADWEKALGPQAGQRSLSDQGRLLPPANYPALVSPRDTSADLNLRARSWLHSNCSACHQEAGGGNARINLEFSTPLDQMRLLDEKPIHTTFDLPDARLVAPGSPERSVLLKRISTRGTGQMPPLSSHLPDEEGVRLISDWIRSLGKK